MPAAIAIPLITGALGVGGSIASGIIGSGAAKSAAAGQTAAAQQAGNLVTSTIAQTNPSIGAAAGQAGADVTAASAAAGAGVTSAADRYNGLLNPYTQTGNQANDVLSNNIANGTYSSMPTMAQLQVDPGYAFREQQAELALERSAAAKGGLNSGGESKALIDYAGGSASQEYANAFQRFEQAQQNNFVDLNTLAGRGADTANAQGTNLIDAAQYTGNTGIAGQEYAGNLDYNAANTMATNTIGGAKTAADYLTQGANAAAAGKIGSANAVTGAISNATGAVANAGALYGYLKNPALKTSNLTPVRI